MVCHARSLRRVALLRIHRYLDRMQNFVFTSLLSVLLISGSVALADEGEAKENCKITVRKKMKNGKTKLEIMRVSTATREECKLQAEDQKKALDEDVEKVTTTFGYSQ